MIFASLASGSSGNCSFLGTDRAKVLIDCGLSAKKTEEALGTLGYGLSEIDAVFLTHEHTDHIKGLKRLMSAYKIPVYASAGTLHALSSVLSDDYFRYAGKLLMNELSADVPFSLSGLSVRPFRISHDAAQPFAYHFSVSEPSDAFSETKKNGYRSISAAVATDMGYYDDYICDNLADVNVLNIEANHDMGMLANGPYPMRLKRRIMSREGHLSNHNCGMLLSEILHPALSNVLLAHLSRENNTPEAALTTVRTEIAEVLKKKEGLCPKISVAPPDRVSEIVRL